MVKKRSFFERVTGAVKLEDEDVFESESEQEQSLNNQEVSVSHYEEEIEEEAELTVDVCNTPDEIIIKTMVAGVRPDDLDVSITRDSVTIEGKREEEKMSSGSDFIHKELYWGAFSRTINLPEEVDVEEAEAVEKYGLMIIRLPKLDKHRQTKLKVKGT